MNESKHKEHYSIDLDGGEFTHVSFKMPKWMHLKINKAKKPYERSKNKEILIRLADHLLRYEHINRVGDVVTKGVHNEH